MKLSIIVPTYNNGPVLMRCLDALCRQDFDPRDMEALVIVDGSTDDTLRRLEDFKASAPFDFQYHAQENSGAGPARNNAIPRAKHDLLLILNDDFIARPDLVRRHAEWHERHPAKEDALLGFVDEPRDAELGISRLERSFSEARAAGSLDWRHFWTTNISLKKRMITETGEWFSGDFSFPAHEDVEFGYRLSKRGLRLSMDPEARGLHDHPMSYPKYMRRAYQSGYCLTEFYKLHPELEDYLVKQGMTPPRSARALIADLLFNPWTAPPLRLAARALLRLRRDAPAAFLLDRLFGYHHRRGVRDGLRRLGAAKNPRFGRIAELAR